MRRRLKRLNAPVPRTSAIPAVEARESFLAVESFRADLGEGSADKTIT
jgi:hypothetical protein